eukprot:scaffold4658_cov118-Cylindrotheca_fusiformis.AAC.18
MKLLSYNLLFAAALLISSTTAFIREPQVGGTRKTFSSSTQVNVFDFLKEGKKKLVKSLAGEYDEAAIKDRVDGLIGDNPVLMFSFTTCPFCLKAKQVLDEKKAKYTVVELDTDPDGKAIRAEMADFVGRTSVPAIWIQGQFVGGCNDGPMGGLIKLNEAGQLDGLLKTAGAIE